MISSKFQIEPYRICWVSKIHRYVISGGHDPKSSVFFMYSFEFRTQQAIKPTPARLYSSGSKILLTEVLYLVTATPFASSDLGGFCAHYGLIPKVAGA
jgi:hypothetical protein